MNRTRIRILALAAGDLFTIFLALTLAFQTGELAGLPVTAKDAMVFWGIAPCFLICAAFVRLYNGNVFYPGAPLPPVEEIRRMTFTLTLSWILICALPAVTGQYEVLNFSVPAAAWLISCIGIIPVRTLVRRFLKHRGIGQTPVLIAGGGAGGRLLAGILSDLKSGALDFDTSCAERPRNGDRHPDNRLAPGCRSAAFE